MHGAVAAVLLGLFLVGACNGGEDRESEKSGASKAQRRSEAVSIRTSLTVAATEGAEPIATGEVLAGSTLGGSPFCVGGTIHDSHANSDPAVEPYGPIARTITCPNGTVKIGLSPTVNGLTPGPTPEGPTQTGTWTLVSGTGAFEGLHGSGEVEITYDLDDDALAQEALTGTVTR